MRVYVSGPMTGIEDENRQAFRAAGVRLREAGHVPVLPMDYEPAVGRCGGDPDWHDYIAADILAMADVDGIAYLPGADDSPGSRIERIVAERMGLCEVQLLPVWEHAAPCCALPCDADTVFAPIAVLRAGEA